MSSLTNDVEEFLATYVHERLCDARNRKGRDLVVHVR
jgi:hypothetical protein